MTITQNIITISAVVLGTMLTRFLPFIIFPEGENTPNYIKYLGTVLPYVTIGLLVVYCLKDAVISTFHALPECIAIILHQWKRISLSTLQVAQYYICF